MTNEWRTAEHAQAQAHEDGLQGHHDVILNPSS